MTYALNRELALDYELELARIFAAASLAAVYFEWRRYQLDRASISDATANFSFREGLTRQQDLLLVAGKSALIRYTNTGSIPLLAISELEWSCNGIEKDLSDGVTIISGNEFTVELTEDDTESLIGSYLHECAATDSTGIYPLSRGTLVAKRTIL